MKKGDIVLIPFPSEALHYKYSLLFYDAISFDVAFLISVPLNYSFW